MAFNDYIQAVQARPAPVFVALLLIIPAIIDYARKNAWQPVDARCVDIYKNRNDGKYGPQIIQYEYTYWGKIYRGQAQNPAPNSKLKPGDGCRVYVDPEHPEKFVTSLNLKTDLILFLFGLAFLILGPIA